MKILIYENRKQDPMYIDISTPEKRDKGFMYLFKYLRDQWQVYTDELSDKDHALFVDANAGNVEAAIKLLQNHRKYEYEEWSVGEVIKP